MLPELLYFASPSSERDPRLLAAACRLLLAEQLAGGRLPLCEPPGSAAPLALLPAVRLAARLLGSCVDALMAGVNTPAGVVVLSAPRQLATTSGATSWVATLVEACIALTGADPWKPVAGPAEADAVAGRVLAPAVASGLLLSLGRMVMAACPAGVECRGQGVPAAEALATTLTVRCLAAQGAARCRPGAALGA
jgi:hypothetical protein